MGSDSFLFVYPLLGILAGLLAGMLGIGGGLVLVPAFILLFHLQGMDGLALVHLAIGTSLGTITLTAVASAWAHHRRGAVDWPVMLSMTPGLLLGALSGAWLADQMSTVMLRRVFGGFEILVALYMITALKVRSQQSLSGLAGQSFAGFSIGGLSGLVGIGGGTLTVPWLVWQGRDMRRAIATSAACGMPIGLAGTLGFVIFGGAVVNPVSSGYVYWPAVIGVGLFSVLTAPVGAHLAHRLPLVWLRRIFALLLLLTGMRLLY